MLEEINTKSIMPFYVSPEDIAWRMRDAWIEDIENGHSPMVERLIPYLEMEAIYRLKKELPDLADEWPPLSDGFESMRLWWLNEALQNCDRHDPIGVAGQHLSGIGQAAVNVLVVASELREAINHKHTEKSASLGMLLICELIKGGLYVELSPLKKARESAYKNGIGIQVKDFKLARKGSIELAKKLWGKNPNLRIGEVANEILKSIQENKNKFPNLQAFPTANTIKEWIKKAAREGALSMPEGAQKRGRQANLAQ